MTEAEWQASRDPDAMLAHLGTKANERKLRLFACACCRRIWGIVAGSYHDLCEVAERFADGKADAAELQERIDEASDPDWTAGLVFEEAASMDNYPEAAGNAAGNASYAAADKAADYPVNREADPTFIKARQSEQAAQCQLLRDIFGNPFRSAPPLVPAWLRWNDATVVKLAQRIYDSRDFAAMPILADALEEAGCISADILDHCRGPGPHVRGCWVVDLVLGKALSIKLGFTVMVRNPSVSDADRLMHNAESGDEITEFVIERDDSIPGIGVSLAIILFISPHLTGWWVSLNDGKQIYYLAREPCRMHEVVQGIAWGADAILPRCCIVERSLALEAVGYFLLHEQASSEHLWLRDEDCLRSME